MVQALKNIYDSARKKAGIYLLTTRPLFVTLDIESGLISRHCKTPVLISSTQSFNGQGLNSGSAADGLSEEMWRRTLVCLDFKAHLVGQNIAFDIGVCLEMWGGMETIIRAYSEGRIRDIGIRERLKHIEAGLEDKRISLATMTKDYLHLDISEGKAANKKVLAECVAGDFSRLSDLPPRYKFGMLRGLAFKDFPEEFQVYAEEDVIHTWNVFVAQGTHSFTNEHETAKAAWTLHRAASWGVCVDQEAVEKIAAVVDANFKKYQDEAVDCGFISENLDKNVPAIKACIKHVLGEDTVFTKGGDVSISKSQFEAARDAIHPDFAPAFDYLIGRKAKDKGIEYRKTKQSELDLEVAIDAGFYARTRKSSKAVMREAVKRSGIKLEYTKKGDISTKKDVLLLAAAHTSNDMDHDGLMAMVQYSGFAKIRSTYISLLRLGLYGPLCCRYDAARSTGRTSCSGPNMQNMPRRGGLRECFIPRPGNVFIAMDWTAAEMASLAQVCLDLGIVSELAKAINSGMDIHCQFASELLSLLWSRKVSYEEVLSGVKKEKKLAEDEDTPFSDARQLAKVANFGFPGGMGYASLIKFAWAAYKLNITPEMAKQLKVIFLKTWPEMQHYFSHMGSLTNGGTGSIVQSATGRIRGRCNFCQACNTMFQGLTADGAKETLWEVDIATLTPGNPLYGYRIAIFVHDEIILEGPAEGADAALKELGDIMVRVMNWYTPDVGSRVEGKIMPRWSK